MLSRWYRRISSFLLAFSISIQICCGVHPKTSPSLLPSLPPSFTLLSPPLHFSLYGSLALSSSPSIFPSLLPNFLYFHCSQATIISPLGFCTIRLLSLRANLSPPKVHFPQSSQSDILNTKSDHASKPPILTTFQWLPCAFRLKFKLLMKISKALQGLDPACPFDIVSN